MIVEKSTLIMDNQLGEEQLNDLLEDALNDLLETKDSNKAEPDIATTTTELVTEKKAKGSKGNRKSKATSGNSGCGSKDANGPDSSSFDEEAMNKFFENMMTQLKDDLPKIDPQEAQAKINESVPQIFDLMQNLLSKELLYPAMKEIVPKFEEWLKKNELSKEDRKRYSKQKSIIEEIIANFDDESLESQERFEKNLDLMEKMQTLGPPPEELTIRNVF